MVSGRRDRQQISTRESPDRRPGRARSIVLVCLAAVALAGTVLVLASASDSTLATMGLDPDRAQLITSLLVGAVAAAAIYVAVPRTTLVVVLSAVVAWAVFSQTFFSETSDALAASGAVGTFSPIGWLLTTAAFVAVSLAVAWCGAAIGAALRPRFVEAGTGLRSLASSRRLDRGTRGRAISIVLVLVLLGVTTPVFGQMVNVSPDALMVGGATVPSATPVRSPVASVLPSSSSTPSSAPTDTPQPTPAPTPTPARTGKPWLAWVPKGSGHVLTMFMPAPWRNGTTTTVDVSIYTPPEYDTSPDRRYPVLYEAPTGLGLWGSGTSAISALDSLIDTGSIPASIVVFIDSLGAPFPDTECADSFDGQMWMETFIASTIPDYLDQHYRTIANPAARGLMGMSAGGFCSAMVMTRHPDVFSTAISFSGYFTAGVVSPASARPFGSQAGLDAHSPIKLIPKLSAGTKASMYYVVVAQKGQVFYWPQALAFENALKANGVAYAPLYASVPHGWAQVRYTFPTAARTWAARLAALNVWNLPAAGPQG